MTSRLAVVERMDELDTPCLLLDLDLLEENLQRMQSAVEAAGKRIRPHAKTHKCSRIARKQVEMGAIGICAATLREAEGLTAAGVGGVLLTSPVVSTGSVRRLAGLFQKAPDLMTVIDSHRGLEALERALCGESRPMDVLIDVDVGLQRTGLFPSEVLSFAEKLADCRALRLRGIQAYAGHVQHVTNYRDRTEKSLHSLLDAVEVFRILRRRWATCSILSTSGTGTYEIDAVLPEITELQPGSYVFPDAEYRAIGSRDHPQRFTEFAPALRVLATVVSDHHEGFVSVDAGLKALYRDGGFPEVFGSSGSGWTYDWFGDEFGRVICPDPVQRPAIGSRLQLIPSHGDPTCNLWDRYVLLRGGRVVGEWPVDLRGYPPGSRN